MTTTRTAAAVKLRGVVGTSREKPADVSKDKEKAEKRRALGRGLESLLPGPRVVAAAQSSVAVPSLPPPFADNAKDGAPAAAVDMRGAGGVAVGTPVRGSGAAGEPGVPHFVRDDNSSMGSADVQEERGAGLAGVDAGQT